MYVRERENVCVRARLCTHTQILNKHVCRGSLHTNTSVSTDPHTHASIG